MDLANFDWRSIAGAVAPFAPKIGGLLGSAFPPFGGIVGSIAGNAIASAFKVDGPVTPEAIGKAIAEDPRAAEKLERLEEERGDALVAQAQVEIERLKQETEQFRIETVDRQDARAFQVKLTEQGGILQYAAPALGASVVAAFFAVLLIRMLRGAGATPDQLLDGLTGTLGAAFMMVVSFFFGSTARSQGKDDTIRAQAVTTAAAIPPAPAPPLGAKIAAAIKRK